MEVKIVPKSETSETELTITATAKELLPYLEKAAKKLSEDRPLKGFRPGKVTPSVAMQQYGKEVVLNTALELAVPPLFVRAVLDHDIDAISRPAIAVQTLGADEGLVFTATVAVLPQVTLGDPTTITLGKRTVAVADEDIEKELKVLAKMRSTPLDVARPAKEGDIVTLDFKVSMNGTVIEGGESKNHPVHIGEGHFVPQFEEKITGIQAGDTREFTMQFPDTYTNEELQGKTADVWVQAHAVQQSVLPELNDAFAQKLGKFATLTELKKTLAENLVRDRTEKEQDRFQGQLAEALAAQATFGFIPEILIEREIDQRVAEFSQMLSYQQKTIDDYLAQHQKTLANIRDEMRPNANKAVKIGLALRAFANQEKIEVEPKEIEEKMNEYLRRYSSAEEAKKDMNLEDLRDNITSMLRNQKAFARLEELATVTPEATPNEKAPAA